MLTSKENIFSTIQNVSTQFQEEEEFLIFCQQNKIESIKDSYKKILLKNKSIFSFFNLNLYEKPKHSFLFNFIFLQMAGNRAAAFDSIDVVKFFVESDEFKNIINQNFIDSLYETACSYEALNTMYYLTPKASNIELGLLSSIENFAEKSIQYFFTNFSFVLTSNIRHAILLSPYKNEILHFLDSLQLNNKLQSSLPNKEEGKKIIIKV